MLTKLRPVLSLACAAWWMATPAAAQSVITLDAAGRTLTAPTHAHPSRAIAIVAPAAPISVCGEEFTPQAIRVRYTVQGDIVQPRVLHGTEGAVLAPSGSTFTIPAPRRTAFVIYNVIMTFDPNDARVTACGQRIAAEEGREEEWTQDVEDLEAEVTRVEATLTALRERLKSEQQDVAAFTGIAGAADQLAAAINGTAATRALVAAAAAELAARTAELAAARTQLAEFADTARRNLGADLDQAKHLVAGLRGGLITKIGGIPVGKGRKSVVYDFTSLSSRSTLHLSPLAQYPVVLYGDEVTAIIANVNRQVHPYPFQLSLTVVAGAPINIEPVRPTFDAAAEGVRAAPAAQPAFARAYVDIVLPLRGTFAPNAIPEVTIATERPSDADAKKLATATLVDKAKYPQFRALYRYNFNTGVIRSSLRRSDFIKVRTMDDDPATDKVDESRYRIQESEGDPRIMPIAAFTYYLKPVDIQSPAGAERLIPNPTIGFGIRDPLDNIFTGFSHEVLRNTQIFWGVHWGIQKELVTRNDVSEDHDASAPVTRDRFERAFTFGVTFNVASIAKVFK